MGNDASTTNSSTATTQNDTASSATNPTVNNPNNTNAASTNVVANIPDEVNTAITEYLDIVKSEYEIERSKKESFENRVGIILALVGAMCIFLLELIKPRDIIDMFSIPLTFLVLIKIVLGLLVYLGLGYTLVNSFRVISTKKQANFEVKKINEQLLVIDRMTSLAKLIFTYRDIIIQHRDLNEKRAKAFKQSIFGCIITLIATIVYYAMK